MGEKREGEWARALAAKFSSSSLTDLGETVQLRCDAVKATESAKTGLSSLYIAMPQSNTTFCPVMLLLITIVLTCSATSSTVAKLFSTPFSVAALTFASGNFWPHSVIMSPGLTLLHRTLGPDIVASPFVRCISAAFV